jgi:hypothetical protein
MPSTIELNLSRYSRNDKKDSIRLVGSPAWLINDAFSNAPERVFILLIAPSAALSSASTRSTLGWFRARSWTEVSDIQADRQQWAAEDQAGR